MVRDEKAVTLRDVPTGEPLLEVRDLVVEFPGKRGHKAVRAVDGVSVKILMGETLGIIGESGSGKTTLGRSLVQLQEPDSGDLLFRGVNLARISKSARRQISPQLQFVFQDPHSALDPRQTIFRAVEEPLRVQRRGATPERRSHVHAILKRVGLGEEHAGRYPHELSGGQKQRVNIARAVTLKPSLVVCDEPVSALDVSLQADVLNLLQDLQEDLGGSYVFIAHDIDVVAHIADRIAVMYLAQLVELGPTERVMTRPFHPYTSGLILSRPLATTTAESDAEPPVAGDIPSASEPPSGCRFRTRCPFAEERCVEEEPKWREIESGRWARCHFSEDLELAGERMI